MEQAGTTRVARDVKKTAMNGAGAAAIAGATYYLLWGPGTQPDVLSWMFSIVAFAGALFFVYRAVARSGFAPCPGCGRPITELSTGANQGVACRFCGKFVEGSGGGLRLTADDHVASEAIFATNLPREIAWPDGCCVCGAPATRSIAIETVERGEAPIGKDLAVRVATMGTMKLVQHTTHVVKVPHCDEHRNGAVLMLAGDSVTDLAIAFRSHAYFVAFCERNGTLPRT